MYKKLSPELRRQFKKRRNLFLANRFDPVLNNHPLHAEYADCRSINITGDYRAVFYQERADCVQFIAIGTHHQLFGS